MNTNWSGIFLYPLLWKIGFGAFSQYCLFHNYDLDVFNFWQLGLAGLMAIALIQGVWSKQISTAKHTFGAPALALLIGNGFEFLIWLFSVNSIADSGWREGLAFLGARMIVELGAFITTYQSSKAIRKKFANTKL
jgi:hypothetical protein